MSIITIKQSKVLTMAEQASIIDGISGITMAAFLSNKDRIAYLYPRINVEQIEAGLALEQLQTVFLSFNVGTGKGSYNLSAWSTRKALGKDSKVLKIGIGRKDKKQGKKQNSRSITFKNKVVPALAALSFIAGASLREGKDKQGDKTYSIMVYPLLGSLI